METKLVNMTSRGFTDVNVHIVHVLAKTVSWLGSDV